MVTTTEQSFEVLKFGPSLEVVQTLCALAKHNEGNTLSHQKVLGHYLHYLKGGWEPSGTDDSSEAKYCRAFLEGDMKGLPVLVVAKVGTKMVGFGGGVVHGSCLDNLFIIVHSEHRCRGIGTQLVLLLEDTVRAKFPDVPYFVFVTRNGGMSKICEYQGYHKSGVVMGKHGEMQIYVKPVRTAEKVE